MSYGELGGGSIVEEASGSGRLLLSFDDVQERLVDAMLICWRHADRERGWLTLRAHWPEITREWWNGDYDARGGEHSSSDVAIRPASLTRRDTARMEEAFGWMRFVPEGDERRLIGLAVRALAMASLKGHAGRVPWRSLLPKMGLSLGADGLAKRYRQSLGLLTKRVNWARAVGSEA